MLKFYSLYSGSSGNSLLVKTENTNILVDAGVSSKRIETALNNLEVDPSSLDGILITHEHSDHVQGLGTFSKKFGIPVFVNQKTLDAMPKQKEKISENNINRFIEFLKSYPVDLMVGIMKDIKSNYINVYNKAIENEEFVELYFESYSMIRG